MKNSLGWFIVLVCFGCISSVERPKKPDILIPEAQMVDIMYDVFVLNSAKGSYKVILENNGIFPEQYIFDKYKIDSAQFANSNNYYAYDITTYESILKGIKNKIEADKKKFEALNVKEKAEKKRKEDSLKEVRATEKDSMVDKDKLKVIKEL